MASVNLGSIMSKVTSYSRTNSGKAKMRDVIKKYKKDGVAKTAAGGRVTTEKDMWTAAAKMIEVLRLTAQSFDLPESVMQHFDSLTCTDIYEVRDGSDGSYEICIYFGDDLHRNSLVPQKYSGVDNIVAILNNGYHANGYVYGYWEGHAPIGKAKSDKRSTDNAAYIRSKKDRTGLQFMQQAINDFNDNYGADYNVTASLSKEYIYDDGSSIE